MKATIIAVCVFFCVAGYAVGQQQPWNIQQLAFMSGHWVTTGAWGEMEENWSEPKGNSMMCAYRCVRDGKVVFYEFIVIEQEADGPVMILRHFSPGNIAWEDKEEPYRYPLVFLEDSFARFERPDKKTALTFHRVSTDSLKVILDRQEKDGRWVQDVFDYVRVNKLSTDTSTTSPKR